MDSHEHQFYWSGTNVPRISSQTMEYIGEKPQDDGFKKAIFRLKAPLTYNDVFVANIIMEIDDSNQQSSTHIEQLVKEKMQLISFTVQLLYKNNSTDAKLMKRKIVATSMPYTFEKSVPFDIKTLSYECNIFNPEVGYSYKLEWSR